MPEEVGLKWWDEANRNDKKIAHNLVIVNLQKTPLDSLCSLRIFAKIDDVMIGLMKELNLPIPEWKLQKFVKIKLEAMENRDDLKKLTISGVDIDGTNASVFKGVKLRNNGQKLLKLNNYGGGVREQKFIRLIQNISLRDEYTFNVPNKLEIKDNDDAENDNDNDEEKQDNGNIVDIDKGLVVRLTFYGYFKESKLLIALNDYLSHLSDVDGEIVLRLVYDLNLKKWFVGSKEDQMKDKEIVLRLVYDLNLKKWFVGSK